MLCYNTHTIVFWYMIAIWANVSTDRREWLTTSLMEVNVLGGFFILNEKIALELFGYLGTALVLSSFIMKDMKWLRLVNISGSVISLIYALIVNTMPVAVLNGSIIIINTIQLIKLLKQEKEAAQVINDDDAAYTEKDTEKEDNI